MKWVLLVGALGLDALLAVASLQPARALTIHPVAPPLTRIAALGDTTLGTTTRGPTRGLLKIAVQHAVRQVGTPEQKAASRFPPPDQAGIERSRALRLQIEADAVGLAEVLGPDRVELIVQHKEDLSEWYGEGRVWADP